MCAFEVLIRGGRGGGEATHPAENSIGTGMSGRLSQPRMRTFQRSTVVCTPRDHGVWGMGRRAMRHTLPAAAAPSHSDEDTSSSSSSS